MERLLIRRPTPYCLETLTSYMARLALANRYPSLSWIEALMGQHVRYAKVDTSADDSTLGDLSALCGLPIEKLALMTIEGRFSHLISDRASELPIRPLGFFRVGQYRRVCPVCFAEGKHLQIPWLIRSVTACPKHHCLLVDTCSCGRRLKYPNVMDVCACGASAESVAVTPVPEDGLSHIRYVLGLFDVERHGSASALSEVVNGLDLQESLVLLDCLRRWLAGFAIDSLNPYADEVGLGAWTRSERFLRAVPNRVDHALYATAFWILKEWPQQFHKMLAKQRAVANPKSVKRSSGIHADFPVLVSLMARYLPASRYQFLYDAFHDYLGSEWDGGYVGRISSLSGEKVKAAKQRFIGIWDAATILGVDITSVKALVTSGALSARVWVSRSQQSMLIHRQSCVDLLDIWAKLLSDDAACEMLAVTRPSLHALVDAGILATVKNPKRKGGLQFEPAVLEGLICRLQEQSRNHIGKQSGTWAPLHGQGLSLPSLLQKIFAGRVRVREAEGQGFSGFEFSTEDVQRIRLVVRQDSVGYTRKEAAAELGIPLVLLRKAIDAGLLTPSADGPKGKFITKSDLEAFKVTYVDFHQARCLLGAAQVTLKRWVRKGVLVPVVSTDCRLRRHLFRKADIQALLGGLATGQEPQLPDGLLAPERKAGKRPIVRIVPSIELGPNAPITTAQACLFLQASSAWLRKQVREGRITPVAGPKITGEKGNNYSLGDVARLAQLYPPRRKKHQGGAVTHLQKPIATESEIPCDQLLSAVEAAKIMGVSPGWLRTMTLEGRIPVARRDWPSGYMYFDKAEIGKRARHRSITSYEAAEILGIPYHTLHCWRERGWITPVEGPDINGMARYRYSRADVEALVANPPRKKRGSTAGK